MKRARKAKRSYGSWATGKDVAEAAKVSLITVSRAFSMPERLAPETLKRVQKVAEDLGYIPNAVAGELSSRRSKVVAVVVPTLSNSNFARTIEGLVARLNKDGYELLLSSSAFSPDREAEIVATLLERRPDGIVLIGNDHSPKLEKMVTAIGIPVVELWALNGPILDMAVGFSDFDAMRSMTCHVLDQGRKYVGYVDFHTPGIRRYEERRNGFIAAVQANGCPDQLIFSSAAQKDYESGRLGLAALLEREPRLDAIIGCTDIHAAGAIFECARRGIHVPSVMSVAGFGDFEIAASIEPALTTIRSPAFEMGCHAASMLMAKIHGEDVSAKPKDVGFEIVLRDSVAPHASAA
ncbi:MAG: LacI family DNA-binding transcriptional regulator [Rhizobiaceae bacterium]|nr:LacI family DNA-binding transcriptional regulator [Rhizobiaceae bacterium]